MTDEEKDNFLEEVDNAITSVQELLDDYEGLSNVTQTFLNQAIEALNKAQGSL
jgi:hypothetical protein